MPYERAAFAIVYRQESKIFSAFSFTLLVENVIYETKNVDVIITHGICE